MEVKIKREKKLLFKKLIWIHTWICTWFNFKLQISHIWDRIKMQWMLALYKNGFKYLFNAAIICFKVLLADSSKFICKTCTECFYTYSNFFQIFSGGLIFMTQSLHKWNLICIIFECLIPVHVFSINSCINFFFAKMISLWTSILSEV